MLKNDRDESRYQPHNHREAQVMSKTELCRLAGISLLGLDRIKKANLVGRLTCEKVAKRWTSAASRNRRS
jgi:hypothetical protein